MIDSSKYFDLNIVTEEAQSAYDEITSDITQWEFEPGRAFYILETIVSGHMGINMLDEIIQGFGLEFEGYVGPESDEYMDYWNDVESFFNEIADDLNDRIQIPREKEGFDWSLFFGFNEFDGGYSLMILVEEI